MAQVKDKSKQWWRWLLFVPVGLLVLAIGVVVVTIFGYLETRYMIDKYPIVRFISISVPMVLALVVSVFAAAKFAPRPRPGGIIFAALLLMYYGAVLILLAAGSSVRHIESVTWVDYAAPVLYIVTLICTMVYIASRGAD